MIMIMIMIMNMLMSMRLFMNMDPSTEIIACYNLTTMSIDAEQCRRIVENSELIQRITKLANEILEKQQLEKNDLQINQFEKVCRALI